MKTFLANGRNRLLGRLAVAWLVTVMLLSAAIAARAGESDPPPKSSAPSPSTPSADQIDKLIAQLGDDDYHERQQAQDALARCGFEAFDALNAASTNDDLEIASRANYLLRLMRMNWASENDPPEVKKILKDYELYGSEDRQRQMHLLAVLPDGRGLEALCRLVRFEKSRLLSKKAAVELLHAQMKGGPPKPAIIETVRKVLNGSTRPSAVWLLTWTRMADDPEAADNGWTRLIDAEQAVLERTPNESDPEIVADLIRFQVAQLRRLGKNEATMAAIRRLIKLERDDPSSLAELVDWLVKQKAWKEVDELEQQFASQFTANPLLLYLLAQAYAEQGQKDRAEETAGRAFKLYPDKQDDHLKRHLIVADALLQWGQFAWARREYEYAIELSNPADHFVLLERIKLAEMLHDQGEDLDAAKVLERLGEIVKQHRNQIPGEISGKGWEEKQSRMHFFRACHWEKQNDLAKRRESLDKALENYDEDVDVLIACYRLPNQPAEYHAKILGLIKKAANSLRDQIAQDPQDSGPYNEFAWLIGNTEGDFDEALKFSQKSLELLPETGGYYDTLARVYFAKGDLDNAIKNQMKATELDPHSQQIRRQLKFFQEAADEKKGKKS